MYRPTTLVSIDLFRLMDCLIYTALPAGRNSVVSALVLIRHTVGTLYGCHFANSMLEKGILPKVSCSI